jgi:alpha-mannosidase
MMKSPALAKLSLAMLMFAAPAAFAFPTDMDCRPEGVYRHRIDGKPGREVSLLLKGGRLTEGAEVTISCEGKTDRLTIPAWDHGHDYLTLMLPEGASVSKPAKVMFTLKNGTKTVSKEFTIPVRRQWTVFIYPHAHVDIGYTQSQAVVEKINVRNMKVGMEIADEARKAGIRYVWNPEVVWAAENFLKAATPEEKAKFDRAVKSGEVGLDASYAHLNTTACSDEELTHYFQGGLRLRRATGAKVDTTTQVDVPGMSWGMPTIAAQCGIRGVLDFPNGFDRIGDIHTHYQRPFWWVSPDGKSRVLYIQGPRYDLGWEWKGQFIRPNPYPKYENPSPGWIQDYPPVVDRVKTAAPAQYFIPANYLLSQTAALEQAGEPCDYFTMTWSMSDNSLVDADLPAAVKDWNTKYAYPKLVVASSSEIVDAYIKKFGDKIPEKRGDLTEYWTDGLGSDALRVGYNRISKEKLVQAEALRTMLAPKTGDAVFNESAYDAWRYVLLGSEHTWGYFNPARPIAKEIEKVKASYFEKGRELSTGVLDSTLALATAPAGDSVTVFNTLSFARTGVTTLPSGVTGLADASGATVPVQKLASGETVFLAREIPALGAKTWKVAPAAGTSPSPSPFTLTATTLENDRVRVELDPKTGDIAHLVDKRTGRDFVDTKSPYALNSYRYLKGGDAPAKATGPTEVNISAGDNGPVCASLVVTSKAEGCKSLTREVRLTAGSEKVELLDIVDKVSTRAKEGVHFGFAFNVPAGKMRMDIPWGVMDPMKDQLKGSNKNWLAFQRFVDISNADSGVTWCAVEAPVIEIGDITANILGGAHDPRQWRKEIPATQTLFSWALNNHWHTNFPLEQGGVIPFRYAILPHGAYDPVAANRFGLEQNRPLLAARTAGAPKVAAPVALDNPRVFLSTAKPADDAAGATILRLRSLSDKPETVNLTFPAGAPKSLRVCGGDEIAKEKASPMLTLPPYGCVSLRFEK